MSTFTGEYYGDLERQTRAVLALASKWLSDEQAAFISEFVDSNEFGISVEFLVDELVACVARIDSDTARRLIELALLMNLDSEYIDAINELATGVMGE